jgi:hypothetical protein
MLKIYKLGWLRPTDLWSRLQLLHVFNQRLRLFGGNTFVAVCRHVRGLLRLLALHNYVDQLLVRETGIELLLRFLAMAGDALGLLERRGIGSLHLALSGDTDKQTRYKKGCRNYTD